MTTFFSAWFFDGNSAVRRSVEIQVIGRSFMLLEQERRYGPFEFNELEYVGKQRTADVYGRDGHDGWRLGLSGDVPPEFAAMLPAKKRYGGWIDSVGLGPASVTFAFISAAVVAVALLSPQWLAPLVPASTEKRIGDALIGDFGGRFCHTKAGTAALNKLARSLDSNVSDLKVEVAKIDMVNAVALPGNNIIIFDGLLKEAKSADEVAGVLAHEMGHVRRRHVMQSLLRQMGLSVVLGGVDGGGTMNGVMSMSYTRSAETEADTHSIQKLANAKISPIPTSDFFERMKKMEGGDDQNETVERLSQYLSSHPSTGERKKAFERSVIKGGNYKPVLTPAEWNELKTMCTQDRKAQSGFGFE